MLSAVQRSTLHLHLRLSIQLGSVSLSHDPRPAKANSARSSSGSAEPDAASRETSGGPAPPAADGPRVKHGSKLKLKERSGVRLLMSAPCCYLPACPLLTPLFPASKAATFLSIAAIPSSRRLLKLSSYAASNKRWRLARVSCFKHGDEDSSTTNERSERLESKPADELERAKSNEPSAESNDWISNIQQVVSKFFTLHAEPWIVPWTGETIIQVMLLWIASFCFMGSWIIPFLAHAAGFSRESLTHRGQALYSLLTDIAEGLAGIAILHRCLARFQPLPSGWFHFSLKGSWQFDVGLGCLLFPLVNFLSEININLVPVLPAPPGGVSGVEQSIVAGDSVAMALYAVVVSVCAPVWEEIIFRGFLLPSLTRYMPLWSSIMVSAVAFALAHFNIQRLLPLVFLGVVMGVVFARSRNLLPSMLLHSLWNSFVFLDLMKR